jgi:quercetin dioxygenase-like cupin family protein
MDVASIDALATAHLAEAQSAESGRSSTTVYGRSGARLRQTLIALAADRVLGEHQSPGDASVLCLRGQIQIRTNGAQIDLAAGELVAVPARRHDVLAVEPSVLLLTVALH